MWRDGKLETLNLQHETLTARLPSGLAPGTYDLVAVNPDGQSAVLENAYTVREGGGGADPAPTLSNVTPTSADNSADTLISWNNALSLGGPDIFVTKLLTSQ